MNRSRLSGAILRLEDRKRILLDRAAELDGRADALRQKLSALDQTFGLHVIQMEPNDIRPVRPHTRKRLMPYGQLSRVILRELRLAGDWLSSPEIIARVVNHMPDAITLDYQVIRLSIRTRLRKLAKDGILEHSVHLSADGRHDGKNEAFWRLAAPSIEGQI